MMKKILLLSILLMSGLAANAVNWQPVQTDYPNLALYLDLDSIKYVSDNEALYAIKYRLGNESEKVAYIKSDSEKNYIGVIDSDEYADNTYKPVKVFSNYHVFMKPLKELSFLNYTHKIVVNMLNDDTRIVDDNPLLADENEIPVKYKTTLTDNQMVLSGIKLSEYKANLANDIRKNWVPPKSARNKNAKICFSIGRDGSLLDYHFLKSSGDDTTDRSIISAIENTAPFARPPRNSGNNTKVQYVFDYKYFTKSVY